MAVAEFPQYPRAGRFRGVAVPGACNFCAVFTSECPRCSGVSPGVICDDVHPFCTDTTNSWIPIEFRRRLVASLNYAIAVEDSTGRPDDDYDRNDHHNARLEVIRITDNLKTLVCFRTASREPLLLIIIAGSGIF